MARYDSIGIGYGKIRQPDARLAAAIARALGDAAQVLNIGAGAGSYEPRDREVTAVEPSAVMLSQHPGAWRVQARAGRLPFADKTFDAAMATMTVHHWPDLEAGLREMQRVSRRQVVFAWDPEHASDLWLQTEYLPGSATFERSRHPPLARVAALMQAHPIVPFEIPHDFTDGLQHAFWRRPQAYLNPQVRAASSMFPLLPTEVVDAAVAQLAADISSGVWAQRHADLLSCDSMDYGFRILIAGDRA